MKKIKYYFDNIVSRGTAPLMLLLLLTSLLFVFLLSLIAYIYLALNPLVLENYANARSIEGLNSIGTAFWYTFHHVIAPGNALELIIESPIFIFAVMIVATLWGIIVFSLIISFISSAFNDKLESLRRGRNPVIESDHTLILDFNDSVPILIGEFIEANETKRKKVIVILSEKDPVEVLREIQSQVPNMKSVKIIVRMGNPTRKEDLEMVSASTARSVIITTQNDIHVIKQILALKKTSLFKHSPSSFIVVMIQDTHILDVVKRIGEGRIEVIFLEELKSKVFARSCLHPGLSHVYKRIFSFVGNEIYLDIKPEFLGKTFSELCEYIEGGYIIGILKDGNPKINPPLDMSVEHGDKIIILAETIGNYEFSTHKHQSFKSSFRDQPYVDTPKKVLGIGFNTNVPEIISDMEKYLGEKSDLTILVPDEQARIGLEESFNEVSKFKHQVVVGNTYSQEILSEFHYETYDTVALFSNDNSKLESTDDETLLTLLHLQEFKQKTPNFPSIVVDLKENKSVDTLEYVDVDDFIVSNILISKLMAQVSEDRYLYSIIKELVSDYGQEFYLKRTSEYIVPGHTYPVYALVRAALNKNEVFIGYKKDDEPVVLNPSKYEMLEVTEKDRIIVVSDN